jgi:hypothetical protein
LETFGAPAFRGILERDGRDQYPVRRVDRCPAALIFGKSGKILLPLIHCVSCRSFLSVYSFPADINLCRCQSCAIRVDLWAQALIPALPTAFHPFNLLGLFFAYTIHKGHSALLDSKGKYPDLSHKILIVSPPSTHIGSDCSVTAN